MTPEQFLLIANPLPEPMLLVSGDGLVLGGNRAIGELMGVAPQQLRGKRLAELVAEPSDEVAHYLRLCSRSRQLVPGALTIRARERNLPCRAEGSLLRPKSGETQSLLMLRLKAKKSAVEQFVSLNLRIEELGQEIQRRKRAEATAQEQQERLRVTLESIGDAVIVTDPEGRISAMNPVAEALTGWSREEAKGRPLDEVFRIVNEETRKTVENPALRALREDVIVGLANHTVLIAKDGAERFIDDSAAPICNTEGKVLGAVLIFRDISERRQSESALRYQLNLTRTITENATTAIFMMDNASRCTYMNPAAEKMTGFTQKESEGQILHDLIHHHRPDGRPYPMPECPIDRALPEQFDVVAHEDVFIRKNGEFFPVLCNAKPIRRDGEPIGTIIEVRDITQEKAAKAATLKRSEQLRRLAGTAAQINAAQDVLSVIQVVSDEARNVLDAHQCVTRIPVGEDWSQAMTAVSLSEKYAQWNTYDPRSDGSGIATLVCQTNKPIRMTQAELEDHPGGTGSGKESNGRPPMRGCLAVPLIGNDGRNLGLIQLSDKYEGEFTEDDESILVQLAQMASVAIENAGLYEKLREADSRKDEFLATLAHELRNPLAPIRTGLEVMKIAKDDPATLEEIRSTMERQTQQLITLVDDLLDVSRITRGRLELRKCRVALVEVVQNAIEASKPFIDEEGHELNVSLPPHPVYMEADPNRLAQVFSNLLNNAAKYTPEGGRIWLSAERHGSDVIISVRDNGVGISADMQKRVFEMFAQIDDRPMERGHGGLGIGLTLVKSLVEMHEGQVEVHSDGLNQGSEFRVRLPILPEMPDEDSRASQSSPTITKSKLRVLVVDDNKAGADMLGMVVKMLGNEVRVALDGQKGVELAAEFLPDVVLMDIGMPKMNGYEAARHIRQQSWGEKMVLVALTGWGQDEDKRRTKEAGFDHHLVKPAEPAELQNLLAGVAARVSE